MQRFDGKKRNGHTETISTIDIEWDTKKHLGHAANINNIIKLAICQQRWVQFTSKSPWPLYKGAVVSISQRDTEGDFGTRNLLKRLRLFGIPLLTLLNNLAGAGSSAVNKGRGKCLWSAPSCCYNGSGEKLMTAARIVLAVVSTLAVEMALFSVWRWVLPQYGIRVPLWVLVAVMTGWAIFAVLDFWFVTHIIRRKGLVGLPHMEGTQGKVAVPLDPEGLVRIGGELWGARSEDGPIQAGEKVVVVGQDGLQLMVRRVTH